MASTTLVYGLEYEAWWKSAKLAYVAQGGTALTQRKQINHVGIVAADLHAQGLLYGDSTESSTALEPLPRVEGGEAISTDAIWSSYDYPAFEFPGRWEPDSRLVLYGRSPRPATVLGAVITLETKSKI